MYAPESFTEHRFPVKKKKKKRHRFVHGQPWALELNLSIAAAELGDYGKVIKTLCFVQ